MLELKPKAGFGTGVENMGGGRGGAALQNLMGWGGGRGASGLSMNILRAGDKSPIQRRFFTNSAGNLLPALEFLGRLYIFVIL